MGRVNFMRVPEQQGQIMIVKGSHFNRYFLAETKEQVYGACLTLLNEYDFTLYEPSEPEYDEVPVDGDKLVGQFKDLYDSIIRKNALREKEYKEMMSLYKIYRVAIDEENGVLAWKIISDCFPDYYGFGQLENVK